MIFNKIGRKLVSLFCSFNFLAQSSLQKILTIPFIILICLTVGIVGILSFNNGQKAVNDIANNLIEEISTQIILELNNYLKPLHLANRLNADAVYLDYIDLQNPDNIQKYFWHQIQNFPSHSFIYWGSESGEFYGARRQIDNKITISISDRSTNYKNIRFNTNIFGEKNTPILISTKYDPRNRPWYKKAVGTESPGWSDIYFDFNTKIPGITAILPVYNDSKKFVGVFGSDLLFDRLNEFLLNLKIAQTGKAFILDSEGFLVATSFKEKTFINNNDTLARIKGIDSHNILIKNISFLLGKEFKKNSQISQSIKLQLPKNKQEYLIQITPFKEQYQLNWWVIVVIPKSDFMAQINFNTTVTFWLCVITLIIAIFIGHLIYKWITSPILKINLAAKNLSQGNWNQQIKVERQDELGQLAKSFNTMANQLQESFIALEIKVENRTKQLSETVKLLKATQEKLVFENQLLKNTELEGYQYQIGGALPVYAPTYVVRKADRLLYKALKQNHQFCYIFNARQTGKSSLRAKIMHKLNEEGMVCVNLDLSQILSDDFTKKQFYRSFIYRLSEELNCLLNFNFSTWKKKSDALSPLEQLNDFIKKVLLRQIDKKIVIFIDEIDTVLNLKFPVDDFFAFWRSLYNQRADNHEYSRLTIVLIGRTTPHYLIKNPESAPFNIGVSIPLSGFKLHEIQQSYLINGLRDNCENPYLTIQEVLKWTGGQPFLTQKICSLIKNSSEPVQRGNEELFIQELITKKVIEDWRNQDDPEHLKTIETKLIKNKVNSNLVLKKYRDILLNKTIKDERNWECLELFLSGIVRREKEKLKVYNLIYEKVFNLSWVEEELKKLN